MSQNELQRVVAEMLSYKDLTPEQVEWARRIKAESDRIEAAQAVAPGGGEIDIRSSDGLEKAMARIARLDGIGACDALYELAVKHGASEAQAAGFAHTVNGAFSLLEGHVFDAVRKSGIAAAPASEPLRGSSTQFDLTDPKPASEANGREVELLRELRTAIPLVLYGDEWIARIDAVLAASSDCSGDPQNCPSNEGYGCDCKPAASSAAAERVCMECGTSYPDGKACPINHDAEQEQAGEIRSMNFTPDMWNPYEILRLARRSLDGAEPLVIDRVDECIRQEPALLRRAARVEEWTGEIECCDAK